MIELRSNLPPSSHALCITTRTQPHPRRTQGAQGVPRGRLRQRSNAASPNPPHPPPSQIAWLLVAWTELGAGVQNGRSSPTRKTRNQGSKVRRSFGLAFLRTRRCLVQYFQSWNWILLPLERKAPKELDLFFANVNLRAGYSILITCSKWTYLLCRYHDEKYAFRSPHG